MKVALVHDWLTGMRGGEYVLEAIAEIFPKADLYTLLCVPEKISPILATLKRHTSWLQKVPFAEKRYRSFLPLMPHMIETFKLNDYDLIISSSHCVAKGIIKNKNAIHIAYTHSTMRYMWDRFEDYFGKGQANLPVRLGAHIFRKRLQAWDKKTSSIDRVDFFIANSQFIAGKIKEFYKRDAKVIYPFVNLDRFTLPRAPGKNYLIVSAFAPNKRIDLAIEAFNQLKLPLMIVGSGQDEKKLKSMAGPTIDFLGPVSNKIISELYAKCKAFIFPGIEDFGITVLEAMAAGAPVIAYNKGGATETITEKTGLFFEPQTAQALVDAVLKIEHNQAIFSETDCRSRAALFTKKRFQSELISTISGLVKRN
ncbi:MAG: glycosyltransferase [Bdellovibrio sp.]|nr:glycosyltransferase [Bdellovibrio sp.]